MTLRELVLRSAPGLPRPIALHDLPSGLVVLVGPNASGKSTIGRAIRGAMWPQHAPSGVDARSVWRLDDGAQAEAVTVHGRTTWQGPWVPPPSALEDAWTLSLRDLHRADVSSEQAIVHEIDKQLYGGFDLHALAPSSTPRIRPLPSIHKPYAEASAALRDHLDRTDALESDEEELTDLRRRRASAAQAPARLQQVQQALRQVALGDELKALREERAAMPQALAGLPEGVGEAAADLWDAVASATDEVRARATTAEAAAARRDRAAFPHDRPSEAQVADWWARAEALKAQQRDRDRAREQVQACRADQAALAAQVWGAEAPADGLPSASALDALRSDAQALAQAEASVAALEDEAPPVCAPASAQERARREQGRRALWSWLSEPPIEAEAPLLDPGVTGALAIGAALAAVGSSAAVLWGVALVGAALAGLSGACAGGLAMGWWLSAAASSGEGAPDQRASAKARYRALELPEPSTWGAAEVQRCLREIEVWLGEDAALQAARSRRQAWEERLARAQIRQDNAREALARGAARWGLSADFAGLSLVMQADRLIKLADAARAVAVAVAAEDGASRAFETSWESLVGEIDALGLEGLPPIRDAEALARAVDAIRTLRQRAIQAEEDAQTAEDELARAKEAGARAEAHRTERLKAWGVPDASLEDLTAWAAILPDDRSLMQGIDEGQRAFDRLEASRPDDLSLDVEALEARRAALREEEEQLEALSAQISTIEEKIQRATEGRTIQEALAARETARDRLVAHRDEALADHARQALLDWLRAQQQAEDAPALLRRARRWFQRFTKGRYDLGFEGAQGFVADDLETHRRVALSALSDGTRVQLLLAARLAFIEHVEGPAGPTPLFLDEVLSTTDGERFGAVAQAVFELVASGRQVFYATADAVEVARWVQAARAAGCAAFGVVSTVPEAEDAAWRGVDLSPDAAREVPDPSGYTADRYAAALGMARPGVHDAVETWPVALFCPDDLASAATLATQGVRTIGQLQMLVSQDVPVGIDRERIARMLAEAEAARGALDALRIGRSRPVPWQAVEDSGAVSETFADRVRDLLHGEGSDAEAFVQGVASLPRFREANALQLREHLIQEGLLDPRPTRTAEEVLRSAQRSAHEALVSEIVTLAAVERVADRVREVVGA